MSEKCFCHLNGYKVKDADAHARINVLENQVANMGGGTVFCVHHIEVKFQWTSPINSQSKTCIACIEHIDKNVYAYTKDSLPDSLFEMSNYHYAHMCLIQTTDLEFTGLSPVIIFNKDYIQLRGGFMLANGGNIPISISNMFEVIEINDYPRIIA